MTVQMVIDLPGRQGVQAVIRALDTYKARLRSSIERTQRKLSGFEQRYGVSTTQFLNTMASEDLAGDDLEYVEWAGEARLLDGLRAELKDLEDAPGGIAASTAPTLARIIDEILEMSSVAD